MSPLVWETVGQEKAAGIGKAEHANRPLCALVSRIFTRQRLTGSNQAKLHVRLKLRMQVWDTCSGVSCRALVEDQRVFDCKLHYWSAFTACSQAAGVREDQDSTEQPMDLAAHTQTVPHSRNPACSEGERRHPVSKQQMGG